MSRPMTAAGTMPKWESAEYRPPMLGRPWKMCRNLSPRATCSIFEPGSVTAMKRDPACSAPTTCFARSKKYCLKILGSSVLPDLLDTRNSVLARSTFCSIALICAGSVESSTCSSGRPAIVPKVIFRTSGHRLEPPMPSSNTWEKPLLRASSATAVSSCRCAS